MISKIVLPRYVLLLLLMLAVVPVALAQDDSGDAEGETVQGVRIVNPEGGTEVLTGEVTWTLGTFRNLYTEPYIALLDLAGNIDRDPDFMPSRESQVFGTTTSDFRESPFTYRMALPDEPQGEFRDVDNDGEDDQGVQTFVASLAQNLHGDMYLDERDIFGYFSARISDDAANYNRVEDGKLLIWAPDNQQAFPSGFGEDGLLFTEDDPIMDVPQGWSVVNLSEEPFVLNRAENPTVDLLESETAQMEDYSDQSYPEAFRSMIELFKEEYAFTEFKGIDWDAKLEEFLPRFEEAEENDDPQAYYEALRDFAWSIPDGHMSFPFNPLLDQFRFETDGGLGIAIRELDSGEVIVNYVTGGSPADEAGVQLGAEVLEINGTSVDQVVKNAGAWSAPFSTEHVERLQKLRYAVRFPVGEDVDLTYQNPDADEPETVTLTTVAERESFEFSSFNRGRSADQLPLEYRILEDSGYGYIQIYSFADNLPLTIDLWNRAISLFNSQNVPGIVLDMRQNGGGFTFVGYNMMSSFFDEELFIERDSSYDESIDDFFAVPDGFETTFNPPEREVLKYDGEVVVLSSPACASACEFVTRSLTIDDRAEVVAHYPTQGIAGGWLPITMPEDVQMPSIQVRGLGPDGDILIEGEGVEPTIRVPVRRDTLLTDEDVLLQRAVEVLNEATFVETVDGGEVSLGQTVSGSLSPDTRVQYRFTVPAESEYNFVVDSEDSELDTVLNLYVAQNPEQVAASNDDAGDGTLLSALRQVQVPGGLELIVEVAGFENNQSGDFTLTITEAGAAQAEATAEATPESTPEATPEMTPEATIEMTPETTPEATPEMTPEMTPEATPEMTKEAEGENG